MILWQSGLLQIGISHFNHNKPFLYQPRGFTNVEDMNREIIDRHNSIVAPADLVYCLGDCCLGGGDELTLADDKRLIESLNGQIIIIRGNHCTNRRINMYLSCRNVVDAGKGARTIKYQKYHFYLSHYPTLTSNFDDGKSLKRRVINLCGHSHTRDRWMDWDRYNVPIYHCEMDAHDCYPVLIDDIITEMKERYNGN